MRVQAIVFAPCCMYSSSVTTSQENILLIEDDAAFRGMLIEALEAKSYKVTGVVSAEEGLAKLKTQRFALILTDVKLPGLSGVDVLPQLLKLGQGTDVIVMTAFSSKETALRAVQLGAYDFFSKPFSLKELGIVVHRAMEKRRLQQEVLSLRHSLRSTGPISKIIGHSAPITEVISRIEKIAPLDTTALITGESGTGKELISDTIRELSSRQNGPFIKVNCAAIPEHLFENELFGHEKGAFTGATSSQPGKFELARGGTILLDEIGDMPLSIQPKLLRAVEQKQIERLGGSRPIDVDVRIIAATNQHLEERIKEKVFREDLYYRLKVASIHLPPLRNRSEDIPLLVESFLQRIHHELGIYIRKVTPEAMSFMCTYTWPGNVRQLANILEGAAISAPSETLTADDIRKALGHKTPSTKSTGDTLNLKKAVNTFERQLILKALSRTQGNQTEAAGLLGLTPKNLWAKLKKHNLDSKTFKRRTI
ncbi:DNA-binding transcriptional response regulator, NtrC family, contains REC, AAA-type ATPase, and a Fis-type DNA-binding domains [Desulfobaculum bizertense DSM 18034]|uniref:DNA-binding transcriptional response regulator, NtrC family, contains REC, AAA-type ATPase, and a Fis-type DNA-binding domains n=2 Tax=Desulfobaculum TaxID=1433996 RepID=A0A1T4W8X5_9BACT|nr:DNA-binding transcriptional response regulator, NtrC family, contains REC, AAA-type ATPase, and a Fis-type DNA-binding domains [Desulfobaculum bizertense DSM 18034]